jgi:glycerophosphoryl diester phosphodiesterase
MSFSPAAMNAVRSIPASKGLLSTAAPPASTAGRYAFVSVRYDHLTSSRVRAYHAAGADVYAWTPNSSVAWRRLTAYGVDRVVTDLAPDYLDWAEDACDF